jgi:hypothetical protein
MLKPETSTLHPVRVFCPRERLLSAVAEEALDVAAQRAGDRQGGVAVGQRAGPGVERGHEVVDDLRLGAGVHEDVEAGVGRLDAAGVDARDGKAGAAQEAGEVVRDLERCCHVNVVVLDVTEGERAQTARRLAAVVATTCTHAILPGWVVEVLQNTVILSRRAVLRQG